MDQFYVTLPSNVSSKDYFPNNTIANYITKLAQSIKLEGSWLVGLREISYTKSWYNVNKESDIFLFDGEFNVFNTKNGILKINAGHYENINDLINLINYNISEYNEVVDEVPIVEYDTYTNIARIRHGLNNDNKIWPYLGELETLLGIRNEGERYETETAVSGNVVVTVLETGRRKVSRPVEISGGFHSLFVYCDIVRPNFVGDSFSSLLKVVEVPSKSKFRDQVVLRYNQPDYYPLIGSEVETIEIDIKDDSGIRVPFNFGRVIITLHFKKYA